MINLLDKNIAKILTVFSISPGSRLSRKILKEKTQMPNVILDKTLFRLINLKFVLREKNFFILNFKKGETKKVIDLLYENYNKLKQLPLKEYFIISDICEELSKIRNIGEVYLFGSYAKLIFTEKSDIDIAIISEEVNKKEVAKFIKKLGEKYSKVIEVHHFTEDFYKNKKDPLVKEILTHGVKII